MAPTHTADASVFICNSHQEAEYVLMVHGSADEVERAKSILAGLYAFAQDGS